MAPSSGAGPARREASSEVPGESEFWNDLAFDQVLLDDLLEDRRRAGMIPNRFGINDGDRAVRADAQAVHLAPVNEWLRPRQLQFLEPLFQVLPRLDGLLARRTMGIGLIGAQKNMPRVFL